MTVLVTAASGKVGREVTAQLRTREVAQRTGSGHSAIPLDWSDPANWPAVLDGVDRVFVIVPDGDDGHCSVTGLGYAVVQFLNLVQHRGVELHLQHSDLEWTILRPNWFFQNLTGGPLRNLAEAHAGVLRLPAGDASVSFIDTRGITAMAVEAPLEDHHGRECSLTEAQSLTTLEHVAEACGETPVPVQAYEPISELDFRRTILDLGWHPDYTDTVTSLLATIAI